MFTDNNFIHFFMPVDICMRVYVLLITCPIFMKVTICWTHSGIELSHGEHMDAALRPLKGDHGLQPLVIQTVQHLLLGRLDAHLGLQGFCEGWQ